MLKYCLCCARFLRNYLSREMKFSTGYLWKFGLWFNTGTFWFMILINRYDLFYDDIHFCWLSSPPIYPSYINYKTIPYTATNFIPSEDDYVISRMKLSNKTFYTNRSRPNPFYCRILTFHIYVTHASQSHDPSGEEISCGTHTHILFWPHKTWRASLNVWSAQCRGHLRDSTNIKDDTHHSLTRSF